MKIELEIPLFSESILMELCKQKFTVFVVF